MKTASQSPPAAPSCIRAAHGREARIWHRAVSTAVSFGGRDLSRPRNRLWLRTLLHFQELISSAGFGLAAKSPRATTAAPADRAAPIRPRFITSVGTITAPAMAMTAMVRKGEPRTGFQHHLPIHVGQQVVPVETKGDAVCARVPVSTTMASSSSRAGRRSRARRTPISLSSTRAAGTGRSIPLANRRERRMPWPGKRTGRPGPGRPRTFFPPARRARAGTRSGRQQPDRPAE